MSYSKTEMNFLCFLEDHSQSALSIAEIKQNTGTLPCEEDDKHKKLEAKGWQKGLN